MTSEVSLSPVRILDAPRLKSAGFSNLKMYEISAFLRETISDPSKSMYLVTLTNDPNQKLLAYAGLDSIHPVHQNAVLQCHFASRFTGTEAPAHTADPDEEALRSRADSTGSTDDPHDAAAVSSCRNTCITTMLHASDNEISLETKKQVVDALLRLAFFSLNLHRISWIIPVSDKSAGEIALACGMRQEAVLEEAYCENDRFVDAGLFSLLATEYPDYSVAFVPYPHGVLAVRGSSAAVEGIRFYAYAQVIEDPFERRSAIRTGTADSSGRLLPQGAEAYLRGAQQLPDEVAKCVRELKEYFAKARTNFSVRVNFPYGSDFQRHVWQELQKIPYGSTVSYEDIALALTGNDKIAARNLSRAVGSACADNPIPILIPCHRVIGKDGRLVGFSGGVENKEFLLDHEIFGFFRDVQ